jgi:GPI mannosyltransferase 3
MILNEKLNFRQSIIPILGFLCLILTAIYSEGFYRGDEHYQLLEFAHYILGKTSSDQLCWEFHSKLRPSLQPFIAAGTILTWEKIGVSSPYFHATFLRIITALISFIVIKLSIKEFSKMVETKILEPIFYFIWFVVFISVRFSSETWSALFFMLAFLFWFKWKDKRTYHLLFIGALAGISFQFRFQTAIMSIGFFAWLIFIAKTDLRILLILFIGFLTTLLCCTILDSIMYGELTFAPYHYFYVNLIENKVSSFGVSPWYHYFEDLLNKTYFIYGILILVGISFVAYLSPKNVINYIVIPFVIFHCLVGHKEMRFLFPIVYFIPLYIGYVYRFMIQKKQLKRPLQIGFTLSNTVLLLCCMFFSFNPIVKVRHWLYDNATSKDVLYIIEDNPFDTGLPYNFYKTENEVKVKIISNPTEITVNEGGKVYLFVSNRKKDQKYEIPENSSLIIQSIPRTFTEILNINGWANRSTIARFYEIENKSTF